MLQKRVRLSSSDIAKKLQQELLMTKIIRIRIHDQCDDDTLAGPYSVSM